MTSTESGTENKADSELAELPPPRRPWRLTTLIVLWLGATGSLWLAMSVLPDVSYSLSGGDPVGLGELGRKSLDERLANHWVQGAGELSVTKAVRYKRPLERDSYRLAQLADNPRVWVQVRVPENEEGPRFVPPASFVGRLLPVSELGLRHAGLRDAVAKAGIEPLYVTPATSIGPFSPCSTICSEISAGPLTHDEPANGGNTPGRPCPAAW